MMPQPGAVVEMPPRRAVVVEMQPRDGSARMRVLERTLAYEHCLGVLKWHCASAENEYGEECRFDLESASPSSDIRALLNDVVRYLEWRGLRDRARRRAGGGGMSETRPKFTPGPWRTYTGHRKVIPIGSDAGSIATASGGRAATCYTGAMSREEALANAHLIAAAPEMYAKLAELRDEMQCVCRLNAVAASLGAGIPCTRCELDQLLAKAEGRVPSPGEVA